MRFFVFALLVVFSQISAAVTVDLRAYFPDNAVNLYNKSDGSKSVRYTFQRSLPGAPTGIDSLYSGYMSLGKSGKPYMWRKEYFRSGAWCTDTYGVLFMGDDLSVTETGDWTAGTACNPDRAQGYRYPGSQTNAGLLWSAAGGLSTAPTVVEVDVWKQMTPGASMSFTGVKAYSRVGLIEHLDSYTPAYGRDITGSWGSGFGKTYYDVIHIVMYHGTLTPNVAPVRCIGPLTAYGTYYQSFKSYSSYAIELWLAAGVGVIQETTPFIEDASAWGGTISNCSGDIFANPPGSWKTYIDQQ